MATIPVPDKVLDAIASFFDSIHPDSFRRSFFYVLTAYAGSDYYHYSDPVDVTYLLEELRGLFQSVEEWVAETEGVTGQGPSGFARSEVFYPGRLSQKTQAAPVAALVWFFRRGVYAHWRDLLDTIQYFALSRQCGIEDGEPLDTLQFYHDVSCFIEACKVIAESENKKS